MRSYLICTIYVSSSVFILYVKAKMHALSHGCADCAGRTVMPFILTSSMCASTEYLKGTILAGSNFSKF